MDKVINIAIDGPAGSGKSTIARIVANQLNMTYIDTGAMFRAIALKLLNSKVDINSKEEIIDFLKDTTISIEGEQIFLDKKDVTKDIRSNEVSVYTSEIAQIKEIRKFLLKYQRDIAKGKSVVMDGRDISTVVLPDADVKIFLTASSEIRANRRFKELVKNGNTDVNEEDIKKELEVRDKADSKRKNAPLKISEDAIILDNSNLTIDETVEKILKIVEEENNAV